jgi:hypothetical protein
MSSLNLGWLKVGPRAPAVLFKGPPDIAVIRTGSLGFAGAAEADRLRWINSFRRLLDGLDAPLQVLIEVVTGAGSETSDHTVPRDFDEMRGADMVFMDRLAQSSSSHRFETSLITSEARVRRLEPALQEIGVRFEITTPARQACFGEEGANAYRHSGGYSRTWYVERLPGTELEAGWIFRLLPQELNLRLSWHATPLPVAWIVDYLQRQLINMRASRLIEQEAAGAVDPLLGGALPTAEDLQRRLASSQDKAFHISIYLTLTCASVGELEAGALRVESAARAVLCSLQPCTLRMLDGYLATLPLAVDRLGRKRVLDSTALATFFPWLEPDLQQQGGLVVGRNSATGAPVLVDPFDQRRYANANIGVFGHSGAGKTYVLSSLALGALGRGVQVYVIDPEHEYGALARQVGGIDVQLALGAGHALNVLDLRPSDRRGESWLGPAAADVVDLCATICGGLDEAERALLERAVRTTYADLEQPVLGDVAARLASGSRVATILQRWVHGSLGQIFSSPTNVDLEAPIVTFGMRELRDEMVAPVHFLLAEALWARIKRKNRRRMLVVDELGLLFEDATIRRFVVNLARRIRKYDGSLVFATQNPGDLLSSDQGTVVATNPAVVFFGAQRPGEAAKLQETFHLSGRQRRFLESARRGDFLLAAAADRLAVRVQAPPWQEDVMRTARAAARQPP